MNFWMVKNSNHIVGGHMRCNVDKAWTTDQFSFSIQMVEHWNEILSPSSRVVVKILCSFRFILPKELKRTERAQNPNPYESWEITPAVPASVTYLISFWVSVMHYSDPSPFCAANSLVLDASFSSAGFSWKRERFSRWKWCWTHDWRVSCPTNALAVLTMGMMVISNWIMLM